MIVDEVLEFRMGPASRKKEQAKDNYVWQIRLDLMLPIATYKKIDPILHQAVDFAYKNEDSGLRQIQWLIGWPEQLINFSTNGDDFAEIGLAFHDIQFPKHTVISWKVIEIDRDEDDEPVTEKKLVMQVALKLPDGPNAMLLIEEFKDGGFVRLRGTQADAFENKDEDTAETESFASDLPSEDESIALGLLLASMEAMPGQKFSSAKDLVEYIESQAKKEEQQIKHIRMIGTKNGGGKDGVEISDRLRVVFSPTKAKLLNEEDTVLKWLSWKDVLYTLKRCDLALHLRYTEGEPTNEEESTDIAS